MSDLAWLKSRERAPQKWSGLRSLASSPSLSSSSSSDINVAFRSSAGANPAHGSAYMPYRENGIAKYVTASELQSNQAVGSADWDDGASTMNLVPSHLEDDDIQRFTATGRPMPKFYVSPWANLCDGVPAAPVLLPQRYTDESIIPVVVKLADSTEDLAANKKGLLSKFGPGKAKPTTKIFFMPRGEYLKHFAKDETGQYIGTEPQKDWTREELEALFGQYRKSWVKD